MSQNSAPSTSSKPNEKKPGLRFSLRSVFVLLTALALFLAWLLHGVRQQQTKEATIARLTERGFWFRQESVESKNGFSAKAWLQIYDERYLKEALTVSLPNSATAADWEALAIFSQLHEIRVGSRPTPPPIVATSINTRDPPPVPVSQPQPRVPRVQLPPEAFRTISRLVCLDSLSLSDVEISAAELQSLAELGINRLDFRRCSIGDGHLDVLMEFRQLQALHLPQCEITDNGLSQIGELKTLESLDLSHCRVSDAGLAHCSRLPNLSWLNLEGTSVSEKGVVPLQLDRPRLTVIVPNQTNRAARADLEKLKLVTSIFLDGPFSSDLSLDWVSRAVQLQDLNLSGTRVTDDGLKFLKPLSNLRTLNLRETGITGTGLHLLTDLPKLQHLYLGEQVVDLAGAAQLKQLTYLWLHSERITDRELMQLGGARQLKMLLLRTPGVSASGFESLSQLPELESLSLSDMTLADTGAAKLAVCPKLRELNLVNVQLGMSTFEELASSQSLKSLYIHGAEITNESLLQLAEISSLRWLTLSNCGVSHQNGRELRRLKPELTVTVSGPDGKLTSVD